MKLTVSKIALFFGLALAALAASAASPTPDDIYRAARAGNLAQAQQMVEQVIAAHPNSAKAHYVAAEIYAKEGKLAQGRSELEKAVQLKPGLPFAQPQAVAALSAMLSPQGAHPPMRRGSFPFGAVVIGILAIGIIIAVIKFSAARTADRVRYGNGGYPNGPNGAGGPGGYPPGGYPPGGYPPAGGGIGSGIVGGLATGAAMGAGIVAGEAVAHHFLDGDNAQAAGNPVQPAQFTQNDDMGGNDFGLTDNSGWDDGGSSWGDGGDTFADLGGDDWS